jgi:hypothetical protein
MKQSMDKDTILFVQQNRGGVAFNIGFYRNNYDKFSNFVADPEAILYKMGNTAQDWIDYRRAVQTKTGSLQERLQKAYADPAYRITDLRQIPETQYYDASGYMFSIPPYDGEYNTAYWLKRTSYSYDKIQYAFDGDHLIVTFDANDNINDAMISLNAMFYHFELINFHTVVFKNVKPLLPKINTVGERATYDGYGVRIQCYAWDNLDKQPPVFPTRRDGEWFILERPIEENCFIVYHGIMYEYELDYQDKRRIRLLNVNPSSLTLFMLDDIFIYRFAHTEANKEARKFITRGIGNKYKNSVEFTLPIDNSMVLFNGVDSEFEVVAPASIMYPQSLFSVMHVSNLSFIAQVNFMLGM